MSPKEKASSLVQKFTDIIFESGNTVSKPMIKQVAAICVQELIEDNDINETAVNAGLLFIVTFKFGFVD